MKKVNTIEDYEKLAMESAMYPNRGSNLYYPALGLGGEAGEVLEKIKKLMRDKEGLVDDEFRQALKKELGDVAWYLAAICYETKLSLRDVLQANIDKLNSRLERGKITGSGDDR